ncbi:MAG: hypothetical protein AB7G23_16910 [Vicinamibacterales bacterium]
MSGAEQPPVDLTGTWSGAVKLPTGEALPFVLHLAHAGDAVEGRLEGVGGGDDTALGDGRFRGDVLRFRCVRRIDGADVRFDYTGRLATGGRAPGLTLDFSIVREDRQGAPMRALTTRTP